MFSKTGNFSSLLGLPAQIKRRQKTSVPTPRPHQFQGHANQTEASRSDRLRPHLSSAP